MTEEREEVTPDGQKNDAEQKLPRGEGLPCPIDMSDVEQALRGENKKKKSAGKKKHRTRRVLIELAAAAAVLWVTFRFILGFFAVSGEAMYPKLRDGDITLYFRLASEFKNGDAVVFERNYTSCAGRVAAVAGDVISLSPEGGLMINGESCEETSPFPTEALPGGIDYPYTVPKDQVFLLCDYRTRSSDSRFYGAIPLDDIRGRVIAVLRNHGL